MAIVRPLTEVSNIGWSLVGGTNYATILSDESDSSYLEGTSMGGGTAIVGLPTVTDPGIDTGWELHIRGRHTGTPGDATVSLYEGASNIDGDTVSFTGSFADYSIALDSVAIATITNFANLRIQVRKEAFTSGGDVEVSEVWLAVPDVPGVPGVDTCLDFRDGGPCGPFTAMQPKKGDLAGITKEGSPSAYSIPFPVVTSYYFPEDDE